MSSLLCSTASDSLLNASTSSPPPFFPLPSRGERSLCIRSLEVYRSLPLLLPRGEAAMFCTLASDLRRGDWSERSSFRSPLPLPFARGENVASIERAAAPGLLADIWRESFCLGSAAGAGAGAAAPISSTSRPGCEWRPLSVERSSSESFTRKRSLFIGAGSAAAPGLLPPGRGLPLPPGRGLPPTLAPAPDSDLYLCAGRLGLGSGGLPLLSIVLPSVCAMGMQGAWLASQPDRCKLPERCGLDGH
mmetsp:Transcript_4681/g.16467  ORF Transcript_4681/g.16467 Transcript_4681/m.16467 type:complete len:247 (-) Transcript_4681:38-778(-)